jgi:isoleucyl-tRNA synthetase
MFDPAPQNVSFPKLEEEVLRFWKERDIYQKSLERRAGGPKFVFFEGPPTANGMPHPGHCLTRAIKDLFPRYRTMRGYYCRRKAGWDTHGLPVEVEVCKEMGIHSKEEIETFGIEPFIQKCQQSVWRYMQEWEKLTERLGFWIRLDEAYVTYHQSFVESVWWSLKQLFDRGLLYQGHKIVWWWAQGGTALSSGEVGQGYRQVADPSVYVKFPIVQDETAQKLGLDAKTSLLVWTTTPWTLPSNQFAAVAPELTYVVAVDAEHDQKLILAEALLETIAGKLKRELKVEKSFTGEQLIGLQYLPPFDYFRRAPNYGGGWLSRFNPNECQDLVAEYRQQFASGKKCDWLYAWKIVPADFVTTSSGSGIVHIAPAFGEDDFKLLQTVREKAERDSDTAKLVCRPSLICPVGPDGKFTAEVPDYQGRWVKDCDKEIIRDLKERGLLFHREEYLHDYPFCWRAEQDPLIQYPRKSWFIRTSQYKGEMLANNAEINWLPEHIKEGRFGNFLETNVDWALSRERFWGTPLPIWVCSETGQMEAVGSYEDLLKKPGLKGTEVWDAAKKANPQLVEDLKVHKPYIDAITYDSPFDKAGRMQRVTEVIDCWYDSGAMPFAQWGYRGEDGPKDAVKQFHDQFPADFISEALDQTRGWFYSQLAISTLLFGGEPGASLSVSESVPPDIKATFDKLDIPEKDRNFLAGVKTQFEREKNRVPYPHPFRNCIVLGLMLGEDGQKMSKSKRNYREPNEIFNKYGADALRWYFFAVQPPWTTIRYREQAIKDSIPEFLLRFWNCYKFFVEYAAIDGFDPAARLSGKVEQLSPAELKNAKGYRAAKERPEIDRWVLSELNRTIATVVERMDAYDNFTACQAINAFVDALSNWYIRRCRDRFWSDEKESADKLDAYWTLYECLLTTTKVIAPFVPFLAETLWRNLTKPFAGRALESVHLCDFPTGDATAVDALLSSQMELLRDIASLGRAARMEAKLKVRQPLARVEVVLTETTHQKWLEKHDALLREELNVKEVHYATEGKEYISYQVQPNFKVLGPLVGPLLPKVKELLGKADGASLMSQLKETGKITLAVGDKPVELTSEHVQIRLNAKPGWAAAQGKNCVVVLNTEVTPALVQEGIARDFIRVVQDRRKELKLQYTDRIAVGVVGLSSDVQAALEANRAMIMEAVLAVKLVFEPIAGVEVCEVEIAEEQARVFVVVSK